MRFGDDSSSEDYVYDSMILICISCICIHFYILDTDHVLHIYKVCSLLTTNFTHMYYIAKFSEPINLSYLYV